MSNVISELEDFLDDAGVLSESFIESILTYADRIATEARAEQSRPAQPRPVDWIETTEPSVIERELRSAVDLGATVVIDYIDGEGKQTRRSISPFEFKPGRFNVNATATARAPAASVIATDLDADDEDGIRRFRLDRIQRLSR